MERLTIDMNKYLKRLARSLLWLMNAVAVLCLVLLLVALWYRRADHATGLLAARAEKFELVDKSVSDSNGMRSERFTLRDNRGRVSEGFLSFPTTANGQLPAVLILAGHGTGARAVELIKLDRPALICGIDYPAIPAYRLSPLRVPSLLLALDSLVMDAAAMTFTALDYLCSHPAVDPSKLTVLGASFGVPFAVIAGLDPRVDGMVLLYGGADLERVIDWNLRGKVKSALVRRTASFVLGTLTAPYEPAAFVGSFAPRPLLIVNGLDDTRMPAGCARVLFDAAGKPKEMVWIKGGHIHPSNTILIDTLTTIVSTWLERQKLI